MALHGDHEGVGEGDDPRLKKCIGCGDEFYDRTPPQNKLYCKSACGRKFREVRLPKKRREDRLRRQVARLVREEVAKLAEDAGL